MSVPTGTVTFLFTDIEGSTQLWEQFPKEMQVALARHDALMRSAIESNKGVVFKTIGDAFCATFAFASDALNAAFVAQQSLCDEPWPLETPIKVRMALHSGMAESRDNDYFGQSVNRVARLLGIAHGGQTVLSQTACDLVDGYLPDQSTLIDLGEHRLKDLSRPEHVYQFSFPTLPSQFPPLRSLDSGSLPNNLPGQLTSFVGRQNELVAVSDLLSKGRIVTLTGSGGCGKTRLAIQVAADNVDQFPDGVWYAELASLTEPGLVAQLIASLLGIREEPGQTVVQTVASNLRRKKLLILLDNCEHLLLACAQLAETLLKSCPDVQILATSREPLNIAGEATFRVPSLSLPNPKERPDLAALAQYESVKLLVDRAQSVVADFAVTSENASALTQLCLQLDGIPLAIELAAARIRSLSVEQIASRLDDRFRLLTGGSRTALPRQQTLRALVDWSYDLLSDPERALLRRLSVFAGGWTLEATEYVASGDPVDEFDILDHLTSLVDKSLVTFESSKGTERYRLLETVKRYGREKLQESKEEGVTVGRHLDWFYQFASKAGPEVRGPDQKQWLERLEIEHDNLWLALDSSRKQNERTRSGQLAWTLGVMLQYRGFLNDAIKAIDSGISAFEGYDGVEPLVLARLLYERAGLHQDFGETEQTSKLAHEALSRFEQCEDKSGMARSENLLGQIGMSTHDFEEAEARYQMSLRLFNEVGDQLGVSIVRNNQGVLARRDSKGTAEERAQQLEQAREFMLEALQIRRKFQDLMGEAETLNNLGVVAFERRDFRGAWDYYRDALRIERELRRAPGIGTALANLGEVADVMGDRELSVRYLVASQRILEDIKSPLAGAVRSMLLDLTEGMPHDEVQNIISETRSMPVEASIDRLVSTELVEA